MANHLQHILSQWYPARDEYRWVLASVIHIKGSNYRKTGAMMLINELGQYYGLISGGCLEKSLLIDVKKVLTYQTPLRICFDSGDEGETGWAKALGCGGKVTILLQLVGAANRYQALDIVYDSLCDRRCIHYSINIHADTFPALENCVIGERGVHDFSMHSPKKFSPADKKLQYIRNSSGQELLIVALQPPIHLAIFGGGVDSIPLVKMAIILGWQVTLIDNRVGYADEKIFVNAKVLHEPNDAPTVAKLLKDIDAAIVMTHNIAMDALALRALQTSSADYIGLLGPEHRKQKVLKQASLTAELLIFGPMGFDIGGDLPESVALSVLAQCHQVLEARAQTAQTNMLRRHLV